MWINILETPVDSEIDAQKYRQTVPSEKIIYSQTRAVNKLHLSIILHASVSIVYVRTAYLVIFTLVEDHVKVIINIMESFMGFFLTREVT